MLQHRGPRLVAGLALAAVTAACGSTGTPTATATGAADDLAGTLEELLDGPSGGVDLLLRRDGRTRRVAVGTASQDGDPLVPGRPFRVGSIAKPFVATMVLQLVDEGALGLGDRLGDHLPQTPVGADATIRDLLSHQSAIPNYTAHPEFVGDLLGDLSRRLEPAEVLDYAEDATPGSPGRFAYSNTNYILLGLLIEHVDGTDLDAALRERVTGPLGLQDTFLDTGDRPLPDDLVGGWSLGGIEGDPEAPYAAIASSAWSAGALVSTTDDLAAFLDALVSGRVVSAESLAAMTDVGSAGYGLGVFEVSLGPGKDGVGHNGAIPGYTSTMAIDPASKDMVVVLTNTDALVADEVAARVLGSG